MKTWDPIQAHDETRRLEAELARLRADNADLRWALRKIRDNAAGDARLLDIYLHATGEAP